MDSKSENYKDKWAAKRQEFEAKAERLSAEQRLKYNDMFDNYDAEFDAMGDWTEAAWDEFTAKIDKNWQSLMITLQT